MTKVLAWLSLLLAPLAVHPIEIYEDFPETIDPRERYVIYSHGFIVEGSDATPEHPEFGTYEFPAIKQTLFDGGGFNLIAHHRPANTEIGAYVSTLESWVRRLLDAGVKPSRITLVGFSRGALLTAFASGRLESVRLNTALMGICSEGGISGGPSLSLGGQLLSIYETTDIVGTCESLARDSANLDSFKEIAITTGQGHGAFFQPLSEWLEPLRQWIAETNR